MVSVRKYIRLWIYDKLYHKFDTREINGVEVISYWRIPKIKVGCGYVCIPLRFRTNNINDQSLTIYKSLREAIALRIMKKN